MAGQAPLDPEAQILYYLRLQLWGHAAACCTDALSRRGSDPTLRLWKAVALVKSGHTQSRSEAIHDLELLSTGSEVSLGALHMLIRAHEACAMIDADAVRDARAKFNNEERKATPPGKKLLATVFWIDGDFDTALRYACENNNAAGQNNTLVGWIYVSAGRLAEAKQCFDQVMSQPHAESRDLQALMGQVRLLELEGAFEPACNKLSSCIVLHAWFIPALSEKAKMLMKMGDFGQAADTAQRAIESDPYSIDGLRILVYVQLAVRGRHTVAANRMSELLEAMDRKEPQNAQLYMTVASTCGSLSGRDPGILQLCMTMLERAVSLRPDDSEAVVEQAKIHLLLGDMGMATATHRRAVAVDQTSLKALQGMVHCLLLDGMTQDAELQMEFLKASQSTAGGSDDGMMLYLDAVLNIKKGNFEVPVAAAKLTKAIKAHLGKLSAATPPGDFEFYRQLDVMFPLDIARQLLGLIGFEPLPASVSPDPVAKATLLTLLNKITSWVPGMIAGFELLATTQMVLREFEAAEAAAGECLRLDNGYAPALILQAKVQLGQGKFRSAEVALENALSCNFELSRQPSFMLTKARVLEGLGQLNPACEHLESCLQLVKPSVTGSTPLETKRMRSVICVALVRVYCALHRTPEAAKAVQDGLREFRGTAFEADFVMADATLALARDEIDQALVILGGVPEDSAQWAAAKLRMADIHLTKRRDRNQYAKCYREVAERDPSSENLILLAEAYLGIQEPDEAIKSYHRVLEQGQPDSGVCARIAKAYMVTHHYNEALEWYNQAVTLDESRIETRLTLARLYMRLLSWEPAQAVLQDTLSYLNQSDSSSKANSLVKVHRCLADLHKKQHRETEMVQALEAARDAQSSVMRANFDNEEMSQQQRRVAADICHQLAEHWQAKKQHDQVEQLLQQAVRHDESRIDSISLLAEHFLDKCHQNPSSAAHQEECLQHCMVLMRLDPGNVRASTIMADVMYQKGDYEGAIYHLHQIFSQQPENYAVLVQLLRLLRNHGQLPDDGPRFLTLAAKASPRALYAPGYHYCKGLFARWGHNPREALQEFNLARMDALWGLEATLNMVELYLCPDNENLWEEASSDRGAKDTEDAVHAAEKLLKEAQTFEHAAAATGANGDTSMRHRVLKAYAMMATRQKPGIERAFHILATLLEEDQDHVPALLAMSTGFMMLKQSPKARNNLKRIIKMPFHEKESAEFERAWLMLAEVYMESGKYDQAQDLCKKCIAFNKSCVRAYDTLGQIYEKEASYSDAADHYANSWKYSGESDPMVGYKLAFQYLKAKRFVEAIDVCHKVLAIVPDYAKMREDILNKARAALRPDEEAK